MTAFLFWNLNRKPLQEIVANLARRYEVDVLMLVECEIPPSVLLMTLNQFSVEYHHSPSNCEKVQVFARFLAGTLRLSPLTDSQMSRLPLTISQYSLGFSFDISKEVLDMTDLWPDDIGYPDMPKPPVVILREQASLLGKRTRNLVEAEVTRREGYGGQFAYNFNIVAPTLGPYKYLLFWILYDIELYPVRIIVPDDIAWEAGSRQLEANSEQEFIDWLELILGAEKTRKVIQALLVQVSGSPMPEFHKEGIETVRTLTEAPPSPTSG